MLDHDDIPQEIGLYVENVFFPLDGSAPRGTYTYFVKNFNQVGPSDTWTFEVFLGDDLQATHTGVTADGENGPEFTFDF
jgi:hypothetical protein